MIAVGDTIKAASDDDAGKSDARASDVCDVSRDDAVGDVDTRW